MDYYEKYIDYNVMVKDIEKFRTDDNFIFWIYRCAENLYTQKISFVLINYARLYIEYPGIKLITQPYYEMRVLDGCFNVCDEFLTNTTSDPYLIDCFVKWHMAHLAKYDFGEFYPTVDTALYYEKNGYDFTQIFKKIPLEQHYIDYIDKILIEYWENLANYKLIYIDAFAIEGTRDNENYKKVLSAKRKYYHIMNGVNYVKNNRLELTNNISAHFIPCITNIILEYFGFSESLYVLNWYRKTQYYVPRYMPYHIYNKLITEKEYVREDTPEYKLNKEFQAINNAIIDDMFKILREKIKE